LERKQVASIAKQTLRLMRQSKEVGERGISTGGKAAKNGGSGILRTRNNSQPINDIAIAAQKISTVQL